ncbi:Bro-N domain-containing protein [Sphingomonas sp.]|uniref:Bro-N domain-containing protein n=1 Tax=Sphingomonas sp. TaxID=28214 RepID=UPI0031DC604E
MTAVAPMAFAYEGAPIRIVMREDDPYWVASDLAAVLGYRSAGDMTRMLDDDQKGTHLVRTPGGDQNMTIVSEGGMYRCIFGSKRPEAKAFRRWVENVLLPTLRRTGRFVMDGVADIEPSRTPEMPDEYEAIRTKLALAKEARLVFGMRAAREAWRTLGLLPAVTDRIAEPEQFGFAPAAMTELTRHVLDWMEARCSAAPGHREMSQRLYDDYLRWSKDHGLTSAETLGFIAFGKALTACAIGVTKGVDGRRARIGLKLAA